MKKISSLLFYIISIALFFLDVCAFSFFEQQLVYTLLCFFVATLLGKTSWVQRGFLAGLLCLQSFIYYGIFGLPLLYLIPITILVFKAQKTLYKSQIYHYILLALCLIAQAIIVEYYVLKMPLVGPYTLTKILVNLVVMVFFP